MRVNAEKVVELRKQRFWSQDELALAPGLNIRTVQRIEREASASLQSKKALAAALDVDIQELDYQEQPRMKRYEYKTLEIEHKEGFLTGIKKAELPDLEGIFNREGQEGWRVVQLLTLELASAMWSMKTGKMVALLEREII
ncbi:DUF4177 domain-containing protein [Pleionea sp. CnH1-48]|uniref:DUF4177 domain-containing protein n=1 Tax=Pleionea sp. CnH1-48 TaxID=2954494 RepID=UPI002096D851|nr:DUF4177 domain-containing protein [Pleionea sp. CnH1-48]MCO7223337.1 DUF4177 domain-containing protein [Pleionea sp. CnH1-48]